MASTHRGGAQRLIEVGVAAASADIKVGEMITLSSGYAARAAAGDAVFGWAASDVTSPSADGGAIVKVDVSKVAFYELAIDTGSAAITHRGTTGDAGAYSTGSTVDVTSTTNNDIRIVDVDLVANTFLVCLA